MKRITTWFAATALTGLLLGAVPAGAAFQSDVEQSYNTAVQGQDALDGLDVTVKERTVSSGTNISSSKEVSLKVTGIKATALTVDMAVTSDETSIENYYRNGYYYETTADGNIRRSMDREEIWKIINSQIYLDMTSNYLTMLYSETKDDGSSVYHFAATADSLGDYAAKLLDSYSAAGAASIDSLQGQMRVDADGHVTERVIRMVYTVGEGENRESFMKEAAADFVQTGSVEVKLPDLSGYKDQEEEKPAVTLTSLQRTVYTTTEVNVRSAGSLDASIIGALTTGSGVAQTGVTSDGWAQVQYNGSEAYIWDEYLSTTQPIITRSQTGTMYTTADVNVRPQAGTDGDPLGVLSRGSSVEITATTSNGWTRVNYKGKTGYIYSSYLTWTEPVITVYVQDASVSGTVLDASYGSLTIYAGGKTMMFNTTYAVMSIADTIELGDTVQVSYTGSGTPYTATAVRDTERHAGSSSASSMYTCEGVVCNASSSRLEVTCSDGVYRTFNLSAANVDTDGPLTPGMYVTVTWSSTTGAERTNIPAVYVS